MLEAESWVAIAFLAFLGLLVYLGAHRKLIEGIDRRQARIKSELDQARRLREEAQALLGEFERKARNAETEAQAIIAGAKAEAERLAAEAKSRAEDFVTRVVAIKRRGHDGVGIARIDYDLGVSVICGRGNCIGRCDVCPFATFDRIFPDLAVARCIRARLIRVSEI